MKKAIFILMLLFLATQIFAATTYYVDSVGGNDSNSGTSTGSAWRTLAKVNGRTFVAGDTILLMRGRVWREALLVSKSSGTTTSPITYGAYGSGAKPQINGAKIATGWSRHSGNIYQKSFAYAPGVVVEDNTLLTYRSWDGSVSATFSGATAGCFAINNKTTYVWTTNSADPDSHSMQVASEPKNGMDEYGIFIKDVSNIIVEDIEIINTTYMGIRVMPSSAGRRTNNITLRRLDISNTGHTGIEVNNSRNSNSGLNEITGLIVDSCLIHDTNNHGIILCWEVVGANVRFNTVYRTGWGLDASHGITAWSSVAHAYVHDCIIEGNTVWGVRTREGTAEEGTGIHADDLTRDCTYRYNISYNNEGSGLYFNGTSGCKFYYNISYGNGRVLKGNNRGGLTIAQPVDIEVYNNVFFDNYPVGIGWYSTDTNGLKIKNNILMNNGLYEIRSGSGAGRNVETNYNCVYHAAGGKFMKWLGTDCTWETWKTISGQDANSKNVNPQFVSATNKNFSLQSSSPCIDAGTNVGLTNDFDGNSVPYGGRVDIGALEYGASGGGGTFAVTINADTSSGEAPLTVSFSRTVVNGLAPFQKLWEFGDGGTATINSPVHTFTEAGTYNVKLQITDATGAVAYDTHTIDVAGDPPAGGFAVTINATPTSGEAPLEVAFSRTVVNGVAPFGKLWDFGDGGTATINSPVHTFTANGIYNVTLRITDATGSIAYDSQTITVSSSPPVGDLGVTINAIPSSGEAPLTVAFSRTIVNGVAPFGKLWEFGDGDTATINSPVHTYTEAGTYTVNLRIKDATGAVATDTHTITVTGSDPPPGSSFYVWIDATPTSGRAPLTVQFERGVNGGEGPFTYQWNFGDGSTATRNNPEHTYTSPGTYRVTLKVTDSTGAVRNASKTITVT